MNRRFILIGLAVLIPVGLGWWAKAAASWRPVAIGKVGVSGINLSTSNEEVLLAVSDRFVLASSWVRILIDRHTNTREALPAPVPSASGLDGDFVWEWHVEANKPKGLVVRGRGIYSLSPDTTKVGYPSVKSVRIQPSLNRIEVLSSERFYQWNLMTHKLERSTPLPFTIEPGGVTISRDGEMVVKADGEDFTADGGISHGFRLGQDASHAKFPLSALDHLNFVGFLRMALMLFTMMSVRVIITLVIAL
ncbi:hypothetical protein IAD21_02956 [Abditibacteriota bacterium]|nr:hypothetical protein IAD21_02956 [Abditibacteriota bacterium]